MCNWNGAIGIDFFVNKLSYKSAIILRILMNTLIIIFMIAVIKSGINEALTLMDLKNRGVANIQSHTVLSYSCQ